LTGSSRKGGKTEVAHSLIEPPCAGHTGAVQ
jgi:hypothetical protein